MKIERWPLELGGEVIACINVDCYDYPWLYGDIVDSPQFERFRAETNDDDDGSPALEALCTEIIARGDFDIRECATQTVYSSLRLRQEKDGVVRFRFGEPIG